MKLIIMIIIIIIIIIFIICIYSNTTPEVKRRSSSESNFIRVVFIFNENDERCGDIEFSYFLNRIKNNKF